jgi:hypothetical protein
MILLLRVSAAMYSNIQDCDEGTPEFDWPTRHERPNQFPVLPSIQLLGTSSFPRQRIRVSNMGSISSVCNKKLGEYPPSPRTRPHSRPNTPSGQGATLTHFLQLFLLTAVVPTETSILCPSDILCSDKLAM